MIPNRLLILALLLLAAGCAAPSGFDLPKGAVLRAESATTGGQGPSFSGFEVTDRGTLYVFDDDTKSLLYSGMVEPNHTVRLYPSGAAVIPGNPSTIASGELDPAAAKRYMVAQYAPGHRVRAYFLRTYQGVKPAN